MADSLPSMKWNTNDITDSFRLFKQKVTLYFTIKAIKKKNQVPYILRSVEDEGLRRFNSWSLTDEQAKDPDHIWRCFEDQLDPTENFRVARLKLHYFYQKPEENLYDFVTRCRRQAQKCGFTGVELQEYRTIYHINTNSRISKGLTDLKHLNATKSTEHQAISSIRKQSKQQQRSHCLKCGRDHPRQPPEKCPAHKSKCDACSKIGHWMKFCLTTKYSKKGKYQPSRQRQSSQTEAKGQSRKNIHSIEEDYIEEENLLFESIQIFSMEAAKNNKDQAFVTLEIDINKQDRKYQIKLKVDTGAQGNIIPIRVFRKMFPDKVDSQGYPHGINPAPNTRLTAYNDTQIKCHGSIQLPCKFSNSEWQDTKFYIVNVTGPPVIGLPSCTSLGVVTLHCAVAVDNFKDQKQVKPENQSTKQPLTSIDNLKKTLPPPLRQDRKV